MPLNTTITKREKLPPGKMEQMYELMTGSYDNVKWDKFQHDLDEKDWVILMENKDERLAGFSTIQVINRLIKGKHVRFVFSGDTIVSRKFRQKSTLACGFSKFIFRMIRDNRGAELYLLLISKGFRTYRYLPVFFKEFFPVFNKPTPRQYKELLDDVCCWKFGAMYNSDKGVVECAGRNDRLKPEPCHVNGRANRDPHIDFFMKKNPSYYNGDELACITNISHFNFTGPMYRVVNRAEVSWDE